MNRLLWKKNEQHSASLYLDVYPEYENTIAVLKELGVYSKNTPELSEIAYAQVISYSKEGDQELKELGISEASAVDDIDLNPVNGAEKQNTQTENQTSGDEKQSQDITNQDEPYADQSSINIKITDLSEIQKLLERAVSEDYDGRYHTEDQFIPATLYVTTRMALAQSSADNAAASYSYRLIKK